VPGTYEFDVAVSTHDRLRRGETAVSFTRVSVLADSYADAALCAIQLAQCAPGDPVATDVLWRH
jgi:hypothetical protein